MNKSEGRSNPQSLVLDILGHKIYLENMASEMIDAVKELGAFQKEIAGGPELKINPSMPTDSTSIVEQIIVEVTP